MLFQHQHSRLAENHNLLRGIYLPFLKVCQLLWKCSLVPSCMHGQWHVVGLRLTNVATVSILLHLLIRLLVELLQNGPSHTLCGQHQGFVMQWPPVLAAWSNVSTHHHMDCILPHIVIGFNPYYYITFWVPKARAQSRPWSHINYL